MSKLGHSEPTWTFLPCGRRGGLWKDTVRNHVESYGRKKGCSRNIADRPGLTALHSAAFFGLDAELRGLALSAPGRLGGVGGAAALADLLVQGARLGFGELRHGIRRFRQTRLVHKGSGRSRKGMGRIDWPNLVVAITGASSGIGEATARLLAQRGASVAVCARRKDRLDALVAECKKLGAKKAIGVVADVGDRRDLERFAAAVKKRLGDADVVFANAGHGQIGNTLDTPADEVEAIFRTNAVGAIWTVQVFGGQLERTKGHAIITGSVVSKVAVPYSSLYASTKWALRGWTRGARPELESRGIALTLFNPGYVRTEFFQARRMAGPREVWNPGRGMTPTQVGKRVLRAIRWRPAEMEMTLLARAAIPIYRLMPIWTPRIIARRIRDRADKRFIGPK